MAWKEKCVECHKKRNAEATNHHLVDTYDEYYGRMKEWASNPPEIRNCSIHRCFEWVCDECWGTHHSRHEQGLVELPSRTWLKTMKSLGRNPDDW